MDRSSPTTSAETEPSPGAGSPGKAPLCILPTPEPCASPSAPDGLPAWRATLSGTSREVLARLVQGDPLGVRGVVARRLRSESVLLDADRIQLRVIARIARSADRYRGRPGVEDWLDGHVLQTIGDVVRADHESARSRDPSGEDASGAFAALAAPLGLDPGAMRRATASFNVLPQADRAAFIDLVLRNRSLDDLARELGESATRIAKRARRGLDAVLESSSPLERPPLERKGAPA